MRTTGTLEEAELTQNEPLPETIGTPITAQPAPPLTPEATALIPTTAEPEVVDGEVIAIEPPQTSENHAPPKQKPYWLLIPFTILACLMFLAGSSLLPLLTPTATIIGLHRTY